ncbi:MAG: type II toxin-antitoxin system RelE/ParE family toxin [Variibacter sp.]|nr:type II toxin-antitoxin system RelE/ParE family toxin [Variibacter sp.]
MAKYLLAPRARRDMVGIWTFSAGQWSPRQADRYIEGILKGVEWVAANPDRGAPCDEIRKGYRKHRVGSHMLFYRQRRDGIVVIRILHQNMDFKRHLRGA